MGCAASVVLRAHYPGSPQYATLDMVDLAPVAHAAAAAAAVTAQTVAAGDGGKHDDGGVQT